MIVRDSEVGITTIWENGTRREVPFYTCAHCNQPRAMLAERVRLRVRCRHCGRLICEKTELCSTDCTPVAELAKDHLEGRAARKWGSRLNAIFGGAQTIEEAQEKGLIVEA